MSAATTLHIAVSGSRTITDAAYIYSALDEEATYYLLDGHELIFHLGDARGVDAIALQWARERDFVRIIYFADRKSFNFWRDAAPLRPECDPDREFGVLAGDWDRSGTWAGPARNHAMIMGAQSDADDQPMPAHLRQKCDLLVAIWDGESRGTANARATARNGRVFAHTWIYPIVGASDLNEPKA